METADMMIALRENVTDTVRAVLRSLPPKNNETSLPALPFFLDSIRRDAHAHVGVFHVGIGICEQNASIVATPSRRHDGRRVHRRSRTASFDKRWTGYMAEKVRPLSARRKARFELRGPARRGDIDLPGVLTAARIADRHRLRVYLPYAVPAATAHRRGDFAGRVGVDAAT